MSLIDSSQGRMLGAPSIRAFCEWVGNLDFQPASRRQLAPPQVVCEWVGSLNSQWNLFIGNSQ